MGPPRKKGSSATPGSQSSSSSATKPIKPGPSQPLTSITTTTDSGELCPDCQLVVDDQSKAIECEV